jgi:hypothetical protein
MIRQKPIEDNSKSIEATNTDEALWNDFTLRVEAFKAETGGSQ